MSSTVIQGLLMSYCVQAPTRHHRSGGNAGLRPFFRDFVRKKRRIGNPSNSLEMGKMCLVQMAKEGKESGLPKAPVVALAHLSAHRSP